MPAPPTPGPIPPEPPARADRVAARLLDGPLTALVLVACGAMLATWLPHYLTWPFWSDYDGFAMMARAWDLGERPYRDVASNQFPGPIYAAWLLGRLFGWGRTAPAFAADAALLLLLCAALLAWSRRLFGRMLPGAVGVAAVLGYYLNLDYTLVLQRDWHASSLVVLGLLALQARPGRPSRVGSALAFALAFCVRPQVVLFLPALALSLDDPARPARDRLRALAAWGTLAAALALAAFVPLIAAGVAGDFLRGLRHASYGSSYSRLSPGLALIVLALQLANPARLVLVPLLAFALARGDAPPRARAAARAWLAAFVFVSLYKPLNPIPVHGYLDHPLALVTGPLAALVAAIVRGLDVSPAARLVLALALLALVRPGAPRFCDAGASARAIRDLARGAGPAPAPPGYAPHPGIPSAALYPWADYRETLRHLRAGRATGPRVANLLYGAPALLGSTGRLPALPYDAGLVWLQLIDPRAQADSARHLDRAGDAEVVWMPGERPPKPAWDVAPLREVVARSYRPVARFGRIEVWRRGPVRPRQRVTSESRQSHSRSARRSTSDGSDSHPLG